MILQPNPTVYAENYGPDGFPVYSELFWSRVQQLLVFWTRLQKSSSAEAFILESLQERSQSMAVGVDYAPEPTIHNLHGRILEMEIDLATLKAQVKPHVDRANEKLAAEKEEADAANPKPADWNAPPPSYAPEDKAWGTSMANPSTDLPGTS
jgi:hypothetical protein